jgi:hypothetical protein
MAPTKLTLLDIKKEFIKQNEHSLCSWDPWDCKQVSDLFNHHFQFCEACAG